MSLFQEACKYIPGGVNSPVRAFRGVGGEPVFFERAKGSRAWSADGREYIDYVGSWGPMILGHAHPDVIRAVQQTAEQGLSFGAPTALETAAEFRPDVALLDIGLPVMDGHELAVKIRQLPGLADVRLVALTGYGQARDRARSRAAGFDLHLVKPVDLAAIDHVLSFRVSR